MPVERRRTAPGAGESSSQPRAPCGQPPDHSTQPGPATGGWLRPEVRALHRPRRSASVKSTKRAIWRAVRSSLAGARQVPENRKAGCGRPRRSFWPAAQAGNAWLSEKRQGWLSSGSRGRQSPAAALPAEAGRRRWRGSTGKSVPGVPPLEPGTARTPPEERFRCRIRSMPASGRARGRHGATRPGAAARPRGQARAGRAPRRPAPAPAMASWNAGAAAPSAARQPGASSSAGVAAVRRAPTSPAA